MKSQVQATGSHGLRGGLFFLRDVPTSTAKQALREELLAARLRLSPAERSTRSRAACERLLGLERFAAARTIAVYSALGAEADPAWAARAAAGAGKHLAWPRLHPATRVLSFAACDPIDLVPGERGTREPPGDAPAVALDQLDAIVVPGVGYDADGNRLGRGGGYYDATLAALPRRTLRVAIAFELQVVSRIPGELHDHAVHAIVTESRVLWAPAGRPVP